MTTFKALSITQRQLAKSARAVSYLHSLLLSLTSPSVNFLKRKSIPSSYTQRANLPYINFRFISPIKLSMKRSASSIILC